MTSCGYALDLEESEAAINCVALPNCLGSNREPSGAISPTTLAGRMPTTALEEAAPVICSVITSQPRGVFL
jgi:DNA-binding IclR family transcriptional regulator